MSFLAPGYFIAACAAALAVVALHFLVTREPRTSVFPTVRFVPQAQVRSFTLAFRLSDIPLMLLRAAIVLLIGAALAQPHVTPLRKDVARIVAVDVSRAVERSREWRELAKQHAATADAIVAFGSSAAEVNPRELDALLAPPSLQGMGEDRGSLSAGLIAALRAASRIRDRAERVELVLVSPLATEERDAATLAVRKLWPGGIRVVRTRMAQPHASSETPEAQDGPAGSRGDADASRPARADGPVLEWVDSAVSASWIERAAVDVIGGVRAGDATLIYPFERRWELKNPVAPGTRVIARWIDGEPAAIERTATHGACVRSIAFNLPKAGDTTLRPDFVRFARSLGAPCADMPAIAPLPAEVISRLVGSGVGAPSSSVVPATLRSTPVAPWLLLAALVLLALEYPVRKLTARRREAGTTPGTQTSQPPALRTAA